VIAVAHARRLIEQDHQLAIATGRGNRGSALRQKRPRERRDDQRDRGSAHQQQEPVPDPPPPHRLIGNLLDEHQRRKLDHPLPFALYQMHQYRNGDGRQTDEKQRGEKRHRDLPDPAQPFPARQITE
jgi:hypothetical protein